MAINLNFFPIITSIITSDNRQLESVKTSLFCLSNVTGGTSRHVALVMEQEVLVCTVLQLMTNSNLIVSGEATWVIANCLNLATRKDLVTIVRVYGQIVLDSLCIAL